MDRLIIQTPAQLEQFIAVMWLWTLPMQVQWRPYRAQRTLPQNGLYWKWNGILAKDFTRRSLSQYKRGLVLEPTTYEKEQMHNLNRHNFLGYADYWIGSTRIEHQLRSTTDLNKIEMGGYMHQIDMWSTEQGILLPRPENSEYQIYLDSEHRQ